MNMSEKELRLAKNVDDVATTIRNEYVQGLLDLYNKEKRNNLINETHIELFERSYKELAKKLNINSCIITENIIVEHIKDNYISKDKIKEITDDYETKGYIEIAGAMRELLEGDNK